MDYKKLSKNELINFIEDLNRKNFLIEKNEIVDSKFNVNDSENFERNNYYKLLIDNIPDVTWISNEKGETIFVSSNCEKVTGYTQEEVIKNDPHAWFSCIHPDDLKIVSTSYVDFFEKEIKFDIEYRYKNKNGKWIWLHDRSIKKITKNGVSFALGIFTEISERKRNEIYLKQEEQNYKNLFLLNPLPCWVYDLDTLKILFVNQAAVQHYGYSTDEFLKMNIKDLRPTEEIPRLIQSIKVQRPEKETGIWRHKKKDGSLIDVEVNSLAFPLNNLRTRIVIIRDITELTKANEELKKSAEDLKELNASKDKFFNIIAHDLKGPISGFIGLSEMMCNEYNNISLNEYNDIAIAFQKSATQIMELLDNLLEWSSSKTGRMEFKQRNVDLCEIISQKINLFNTLINQKHIKFISNIPENTFVFADEKMLLTILRNLILNAIKFSYPEGKIWIDSKYSDDFVEISVNDNGVGIEKSMLEKLFRIDLIVKSLGTADERGSGLGLILCKEFVAINGGKIWIESEPGKGSNIRFTLPRAASVENDSNYEKTR